jgi:hypothetical protein
MVGHVAVIDADARIRLACRRVERSRRRSSQSSFASASCKPVTGDGAAAALWARPPGRRLRDSCTVLPAPAGAPVPDNATARRSGLTGFFGVQQQERVHSARLAAGQLQRVAGRGAPATGREP